ncbi:MAG: SpoIIE family protein phosphatase [Bacteroidales bacterium]|nr:SpoIIE family protein phosphatase [Bacteroidales bacterium]
MKYLPAGYIKSFAAKMSRMLSLGAAIVLLFVFVVNNILTRKSILDELIVSNSARIELFINNIESGVKEVELAVKGRESAFIEKMDDPQQVEPILTEIALGSNVREAFYAIAPQTGRTLMVDALKDPDGSIKMLYRPESYKYHLHHYFLVPQRLGRDYWTPPYFTTIASQRAVTYSHPVFGSDGNIKAVIGADILLETLTDTLSSIVAKHTPLKGSYLIALSEDGRYISHPDKDKIANETYITDAMENNSPDLIPLVKGMFGGKQGADIVKLYGRKTLVTYSKMNTIGWGIMLVTPFDVLNSILIRSFLISVLLMLIGLIVVGLLIHQIIWKMCQPINRYSQASSVIAGGDFDTPVELTASGDELQTLGEALDNMRQSLKHYMTEMLASAAQRESLAKELSIASNIQKSMLPSDTEWEAEGFEMEGFQQPAKEVGGDLYYYMLKGGKLCFIIGDVSGKGVPASLVMAQTVCLFKSQGSAATPAETVSLINNLLSENNEQNMFVTLIVGKLDIADGTLHFCNAGHNPMMLIRSGKATQLNMSRNLPVGLMEHYAYKTDTFRMEPGDRLVLYTDGIVEAENINRELYSTDRLCNMLTQSAGVPLGAILQSVLDDVRTFVADAPQSDDITIMGLNYRGLSKPVKESTIVFKNKMEELTRITAFVDGLATEFNIDSLVVNQLQLAIEEAVVNVINYAYPAYTDCESSLSASLDDGILTFVLSDSGAPFDPTAKADPDITLGVEERPIGGLGIFLIKKIMNEVSYRRINDCNVLTMKKKII